MCKYLLSDVNRKLSAEATTHQNKKGVTSRCKILSEVATGSSWLLKVV